MQAGAHRTHPYPRCSMSFDAFHESGPPRSNRDPTPQLEELKPSQYVTGSTWRSVADAFRGQPSPKPFERDYKDGLRGIHTFLRASGML